ncbi:MAG: PA2169 family four-helix-bundle protein [Anaerolineales bacterium]
MNTENIPALHHLYQMAEAGEKGYAVAANAVKNRALKVLFNSYAQRRAEYKQEIMDELHRLGDNWKPSSSLLGAIHRGRITIFATMTIGEENIEQVVLKEIALGESYAQRAYERALKQSLPEQTRQVVQRQYDEVHRLIEKIHLMRGKEGERLVVRLYNSKQDADEAVHRLILSEYLAEAIQSRPLSSMKVYTNGGVKAFETLLAGAAGGAVWGTATGILSVIGIISLARNGLENLTPLTVPQTAVLSFLGLLLAGLFVGSGLGFFIGNGIKDESEYFYKESLQHGRYLVEVLTESSRASSAWHLLAQVNLESRTGALAP